MLFPLTMTSILIILGIILASCLIVARYRDIYEKIRVPAAVLVFIGGLIIYSVGYLPDAALKGAAEPGQAAAVSPDYGAVTLRALFSTCRIFVLENDFSEVSEAAKSSGLYVLLFSIVNACALIITVLTLLSIFGFGFISRLQLLLSSANETYVFIGLNDPVYGLMKSVREGGKKRCVIVVESKSKIREEEQALAKRIRENRAVLIEHDPRDLDGIGKLKLPGRLFRKKLNVFLMNEHENSNVNTAARLIKSMKRDNTDPANITFYVQSSSEDTCRVLEAVSRENGIAVELRIFSVPDLIARQLFESCPIIDTIRVDTGKADVTSDFSIFIAGFGGTGMEVLRKSIYGGQFAGGKFRAFVTDKDMSGREGTFCNRYGAACLNYDIGFIQAEPGSRAFYDILAKHIRELNYIVVALENDKLSMETAIEIQRLISRNCPDNPVTLAVQISGTEEYSQYKNGAILPNIRLFGGSDEVYSESVIINESMDGMARALNAFYNMIYHAEPADNWRSLDVFTKESNRSAAMSIRTKLRLMGLDMAVKGTPGFMRVNIKDHLTGLRLTNLAKHEHMRWNAFHFVSGWTTWELSETEGAAKAKDSANKRHACLVSWEKLKDVTARFNQSPSFEELDYNQVKHIPDILEAAGYSAYEVK